MLLRYFVKNFVVYTNYNIDDIPTDFSELYSCVSETLDYLTFKKIMDSVKTQYKQQAATTKTLCLLAKIINSLNPDLSNLTENEQAIFDNMVTLSSTGYTDSILTKTATQAVIDVINWYKTKLSELEAITDYDALVSFLVEINE